MKFGYRDRIVLLIVVIVLILSIGIFVFIKPAVEKLNTNKTTRDNLKAEWNQKLHEFSLIPDRQTIIENKYKEGADIAAKFTDEMNSVELGKFIQDTFVNIEKFREDEVRVIDNAELGEKTTSSMSYYYYTPSIITYPLYEYADLDGSLAKAAEEKMKEANLMKARAAQTVGSSSAKITLQINREDTMALIDAVNQYAKDHNDTMLIESISLGEAEFNEAYLEKDEAQQPAQPQEPQVDEEGNPIEPNPAENNNNDEEDKTPTDIKPGWTEVSISYRVLYVQAPTKPDVGPSYDETIWEGNEWKTVTAPVESAAE